MNDSLIIYSYGLFGGQLYGNQSTMLQCKSGGWFLRWYVNSVGIIGQSSAFFLGIDLQLKSSKISFSSCIVNFGWSSKNIHQTIYFIDLIDTRLIKVIGFKLPVVFIAFYLMFWRIIMYIIIKLILANLNQ